MLTCPCSSSLAVVLVDDNGDDNDEVDGGVVGLAKCDCCCEIDTSKSSSTEDLRLMPILTMS